MKLIRLISILYSVTLLLDIHGGFAAAKEQCRDSKGYKLNGIAKQTCRWIRKDVSRRRKYCNTNLEVQTKCPFACGLCCQNDKTYVLNRKRGTKKCWWIGQKKSRKNKWCNKANNGSMVRLACPVACDFCQDTSCNNNPDYMYEGDPGKSCIWLGNQYLRETICRLSADATENCPISCGECCADDPTYTFGAYGQDRTCKWLSKQNKKDKDKFCPLFKNGIKVQNACHKTCDRCYTKSPTYVPTVSPSETPGSPAPTPTPIDSPTASPTDSPTSSPTDSPTENPTEIPTKSPTKSPTYAPTKTPSNNPSQSPSDSPTSSPTDSPTFCDWTQLGSDITGIAESDRAAPVALSSSGQIVAVGSFKNDIGGTKAGKTRIFEFSANAWTQLGSDITGEVAGDEAGRSVAISANGEIVAVGSPKNEDGNTDGGQVRVWEWDGSTTWGQKGSDIEGSKNSRALGTSVALTSDGLTLVAGGPGTNNGGKIGFVEVYAFNSDWSQVHSSINGATADEYFGTSVAITADASTIAVGTPESTNGDVFVYNNDGNEWSELSSLTGDTAGDLFGTSVALTLNGGSYVLAIGAPGHTTNTGRVFVYDSSDGISWTMDDTLDGSATGDAAGTAIDLSADGSVLAVGYPGNGNGYVRLFKDDGASWSQINDDIVGASSGDEFGGYVSVSDSNEVAIGAEKNDSNRGLVGVYDDLCS